MRTTTIDPLCEKYYHISPYAWCGNNPVNRIDPDGRDYYILTSNGRMTLALKNDDKNDKLFALKQTKESNEYIDIANTLTLEKGILSQENHSETFQNDNLFYGKIEQTFYEIRNQRNDNQSLQFFKFLSDNTNVEWSLTTGKDNKGNKYSLLMTNHEKSQVRPSSLMDWVSESRGISFEKNYHNHPSNSPNPSGAYGDRDFAESKLKKYPHMLFYIYTSKNGKFFPYTHKSK